MRPTPPPLGSPSSSAAPPICSTQGVGPIVKGGGDGHTTPRASGTCLCELATGLEKLASPPPAAPSFASPLYCVSAPASIFFVHPLPRSTAPQPRHPSQHRAPHHSPPLPHTHGGTSRRVARRADIRKEHETAPGVLTARAAKCAACADAPCAGLRQLLRGMRRLAQSAEGLCIHGSGVEEGPRARSTGPHNHTHWRLKGRVNIRKSRGRRFGVRSRSLIGLEGPALRIFVSFINALSHPPMHDGKVSAKIASRPATVPILGPLLLGCGCIPLTICLPHRSNPRPSSRPDPFLQSRAVPLSVVLRGAPTRCRLSLLYPPLRTHAQKHARPPTLPPTASTAAATLPTRGFHAAGAALLWKL